MRVVWGTADPVYAKVTWVQTTKPAAVSALPASKPAKKTRGQEAKIKETAPPAEPPKRRARPPKVAAAAPATAPTASTAAKLVLHTKKRGRDAVKKTKEAPEPQPKPNRAAAQAVEETKKVEAPKRADRTPKNVMVAPTSVETPKHGVRRSRTEADAEVIPEPNEAL